MNEFKFEITFKHSSEGRVGVTWKEAQINGQDGYMDVPSDELEVWIRGFLNEEELSDLEREMHLEAMNTFLAGENH